MKYDVIVVGGGASGLMSAVIAAENGLRVLLLEKNNILGKKLLFTGGGRCNLTNNCNVEELIENIPGNGKFLHSALSQFDNKDICNFFKMRGVPLKEEDHGKIYPVSDKAETILNLFKNEIKKFNIKVIYNSRVSKLLVENGNIVGVKTVSGEIYNAEKVILTTGGCSYPSTGSSGDGYEMLKAVGHKITDIYPGEVPIILADTFIHEKILNAVSLKNVELSVLDKKGKIVISHSLDLIFTHFGLSGPSALRCSTFVNLVKSRENCEYVTLKLNIFPEVQPSKLEEIWDKILLTKSDKSIKFHMKKWMPERYAQFILRTACVCDRLSLKQISSQDRKNILNLLQDLKMKAIGTLPMKRAFVTVGGVSLKEVVPSTMESKLVSGLYICGELLDLNGYTGGFNLTSAFVTGYVAGCSVKY